MELECCYKMLRGILNQAHRVRAWVPANIILALFIVGQAVRNLLDRGYVSDTYCQQNSLKKDELDIIDPLHYNNTCQSKIVLEYRQEDLQPYLETTLYIQAITGVLLVTTGIIAIVGLWRTKTRPVWPWLVASGLWVGSLIIMAIVLIRFGLTAYIIIMMTQAGISTLTALDVWFYCSTNPRRQQTPTHTLETKLIDTQGVGGEEKPGGGGGGDERDEDEEEGAGQDEEMAAEAV